CLIGVKRAVVWDRVPEMTADGDVVLRRSEDMRSQHPDSVIWSIEELVNVHQPLCGERPSFSIARIPDEEAMGLREPIRLPHGGADLEVMAGETFVVGRGDLLPDRNHLPLPQRIPHRTGPLPVRRRVDVPGAQGPTGWSQVDRHGTDRRWDVEVGTVQLAHGLIQALLDEGGELLP